MQQPLFLLHVEYNDDFFRIGYLEEMITLEPGRDAWLGPNAPSSLGDVTLNVEKLADTLSAHQDKIARCRLWHSPRLTLVGELPAEIQHWT